MLNFIAVLLICQLVGEVLHKASGLPLPGPVIGMVLLFFGLLVRGSVPDDLSRLTKGLLDHLSLLFVPAGVGVVVHLSLVREEWLSLSAALIFSTVFTIGATGLLLSWLFRISKKDPTGPELKD
ncbi:MULTISPECIES: CidA/LrgA family protein [Limibacillus]|mgnify:CR=1 FL=1|jgi:holin-like protein|uniref:Holin-like protein n=1 Tax=Limibacillus halophilus TaxID=1579333 RepID=A0A839SW47_9PROT|nr:CidA/LrgA family protein [Limibacillus halophilus]MBB3065726.1 holin-like protein [Limibacillus halophilus]